MIWSASRLKSWYTCARRFKLDKFVETQEVKDGKERHSIVEEAYLQRNLGAILSLPNFRKEQLEIVEKANQRGLLPMPDYVLSVEGRDLPPEVSVQQYGRNLFELDIETLPDGSIWGLRGAADLVFIDPEDQDTLWIADWKSRSQDDGEIQGSCYALAYSRLFPGFKRYVFEQRSLTLSWLPDRYEFLADDMDKVVEFLRDIGLSMEADTTFAPVENKWCNYCGIKDSCPVWIKIAETPIVATLPAVKEFILPVEFGALIELKERSTNYEKIAEGLKKRCTEAALAILSTGPQKYAGKTYTKGNGVTSYSVKPGSMAKVVEALDKALKVVDPKVEIESFFELAVSEVRAVLEKAGKKSVNNEESVYFKKANKELFEANTYDKINTKAG